MLGFMRVQDLLFFPVSFFASVLALRADGVVCDGGNAVCRKNGKRLRWLPSIPENLPTFGRINAPEELTRKFNEPITIPLTHSFVCIFSLSTAIAVLQLGFSLATSCQENDAPDHRDSRRRGSKPLSY
jgi:hypothetical protein